MIEAFVYCWTDHERHKLYVGYHKGTTDDGYICSSKIMLKEYQERPQAFTRQIIAEGTTVDMRNLESKILQTDNAAKNDKYYNQHNGDRKLHCSGHSDETRQRMRDNNTKSWLGKTHSEETKQKMSVSMKGKKHKPYYGRALSEKTRTILEEANQQRQLNGLSEEHKKAISDGMRGAKNHFFGKKHSKEAIEKMREARKRYYQEKK